MSRKRASAAQHTKVNADGTVVNFVAHIVWLVWGGREVRMEEIELFSQARNFSSCLAEQPKGQVRACAWRPIEIYCRHQKLTSLQSFALKSDQQGSAGSNVFHPSCGNGAVDLPEVALDWLGAFQPFDFGSQGIQPQKNHGRTLAWSVTVHQPGHSTCMESCVVEEQGRLWTLAVVPTYVRDLAQSRAHMITCCQPQLELSPVDHMLPAHSR